MGVSQIIWRAIHQGENFTPTAQDVFTPNPILARKMTQQMEIVFR